MKDISNEISSKPEDYVPHNYMEFEKSPNTISSSLPCCPNGWTEEEWTLFQRIDNFDVSQDEGFHQGLEHIIESLMYPTMNRNEPINSRTVGDEELSVTNSTTFPSLSDHLPLTGREFERELSHAKAVYVAKLLGLDIDFSRYLEYRDFLVKQSLLNDRDILSSRCPYLNQFTDSSPFPKDTIMETSKNSASIVSNSCPFLNSVITGKQLHPSINSIKSPNEDVLEFPSNDF